MHRWVAVAAALVAAACVSIPPYTPPIGVTWDESLNGGGTVTSQPVRLHFPGGGVFPYPDSLVMLGTEVLGHSPQAQCNVEDQVGIALYPAPRITNDTMAMSNGGNSSVATLRGPAVVQVQVTWNAHYDCTNGTHYPDGVSTFTMFPNGRIARYDEVHASDSMAANAGSCVSTSCSTDDMWFVTSFWTFDEMRFDGVLAQTLMPLSSLSQGTDVAADEIACVQSGSQYSATVTWRDVTQNRARKPSPTTIALIHNIHVGPDIGTLDANQNNITSSLTVAPTGCASSDADIATNAMIRIANEPVRAGTDGIFGGAGLFDSPGVAIPNATFEITGPTAGPFAVWVRFAEPVETIQLEKSIPTSRPWYVPQPTGGNGWIIYFLDPLEGSQTITVHPR